MRLALANILVLVVSIGNASDWGVARTAGGDVPLSSRDASGAVVLTDSALPADATEIVFTDSGGSLAVSGITLTNRTLRFTAGRIGYTLRTDGAAAMFSLSGGNWTFSGLSFEGCGLPAKAHYRGGGIDCEGGSLAVTNCTFSNLGARFCGGAICARMMTGGVTVSDCSFTGNSCGSYNGTGGAIYASGDSGVAEVTLRVNGCAFTGNSAQSGGAVTTVHNVQDDEIPVRLAIGGTSFEDNTADFSGGAVYAQGDVTVTNSTFSANTAGVQGGAMCLGGTILSETHCEISPQTLFSGNRTVNATVWTCGGAIALWGAGNSLSVDGRHVVFAGNEALSGKAGFGGAVFAATGTVTDISFAAFNGNAADTAGGAVCVWDGSSVFSTCVFSNDTVRSSSGYGGAISADGGTLTVANATIRFANGAAIDAYRAATKLVNTVAVDNGTRADVESYGDGASLAMDYVAYGKIGVSDGVLAALVTNRCLNGMTSEIYRGDTLLLDTSFYNPVASEGLEQSSRDYRDVRYGWQGDSGYSMGAYECPAPDDEPNVELVSTVWYHNRADGYYYPRFTLRFLGGDASRILSVKFSCGGTGHALPEGCVAKLRTATRKNELFEFGVDDAHWIPSAGSNGNFGYIVGWADATEKSEIMLFPVADADRPSVAVVGAENPVSLQVGYEPTMLTSVLRLLSVASLPMTANVSARFNDFSVGGVLSGRAETAAGATVRLLGCKALGDGWQTMGTLELDGEGRFSCPVPEGLQFFRLEAEVPR